MTPLLITMDLEIAHDRDLADQAKAIDRLNIDLKAFGIKATHFTTGDAADKFPLEIKKLHDAGHEIGCHGLHHSDSENFRIAEINTIKKTLKTASDKLESITGLKPVCFRGPFMGTSTCTQQALIEQSFDADYSICSQRLDFFNSKGGDKGWLYAPRNAYHPSSKSVFKHGRRSLWCVPMRSLGLPFLSGITYLFGLNLMKLYFKILLLEGRKKNKPIVYLFHSYEFTDVKSKKIDKRPFIHRLYVKNPEKRYKLNMDLLRYMTASKDVTVMTSREYLNYLNKK